MQCPIQAYTRMYIYYEPLFIIIHTYYKTIPITR